MSHADARLPVHLWADEIRTIANEELFWRSDDPHSVRRGRRLIRIAAEIAAAQDVRGADAIEQLYQGDLLHLTPYCGGDAAIFDEHGHILLIQRRDNGLWAMPGGALEVGETPAEGTCREAWEETAIEVDAIALSGVYDSRLCGTQLAYHLYHFVFLCRPRECDAQPQLSDETIGVAWYARNRLPQLSPGHDKRIEDAFGRWSGELGEAVFDRAS